MSPMQVTEVVHGTQLDTITDLGNKQDFLVRNNKWYVLTLFCSYPINPLKYINDSERVFQPHTKKEMSRNDSCEIISIFCSVTIYPIT